MRAATGSVRRHPEPAGGPTRPSASAVAAGLLAAIVVLVLAPPARAGGDFVDLAVGGSRVWFVGEPGVRELDARTGRTLAMRGLVGAAYPLSVALAGGAAWVASVENGYVWGTLTRIDVRSGKRRVLWRRQDSSVQYVAAGAGSIWAMIGTPGGGEIARFRLDGRLQQVWRLGETGRMAADGSGCWISGSGWLLHIDPAGRFRRVLQAPLGDVATGAGAVWLPQATSVLRIDERTGRSRRLHTGPLRLGGFQHDLAAGDASLWALTDAGRSHTTLERFDPGDGRRSARVDVPGIADALIVEPHAVWIASVIAPPNRPASGYDVIRLDPHSLRRTLLVQIG